MGRKIKKAITVVIAGMIIGSQFADMSAVGSIVQAEDGPMRQIALYTLDGRVVHREESETHEWAIDTRSYTGPIFVLSIQLQSGEYRHLKVGRNR